MGHVNTGLTAGLTKCGLFTYMIDEIASDKFGSVNSQTYLTFKILILAVHYFKRLFIQRKSWQFLPHTKIKMARYYLVLPAYLKTQIRSI
jgi:hypothetical protein